MEAFKKQTANTEHHSLLKILPRDLLDHIFTHSEVIIKNFCQSLRVQWLVTPDELAFILQLHIVYNYTSHTITTHLEAYKNQKSKNK